MFGLKGLVIFTIYKMDFLKNISPREYQEKILESCIKDNCLVVLPTGLGKTLIALMLTIERMKLFPGEKVVFLAPTKPLAEQHLISFKKYLPELFADMQLFTGSVNAVNRKKIWKTADIIFSTPQCIANDLRKNLYNLNEVCLLIEDEAHRCIKNYDYNFVAQKYKSQSVNPRILGLTASPGSESSKIKEICRNLSINKVELRTRESDDVKHYLQEREFEKVILEFPSEFEEMRHILTKIINEYIEELRMRKVLFGPATKTGLIELQKKISATLARGNSNFNYMLGASACAQAIKLNHALELLETQTLRGFNSYLKELFTQASKKQSKGVVKLVSKQEFNFIYMQSNELLAKKKEHPKVEKLSKIIEEEFSKNPESKIIVFTQFRETAKKISEELNNIKNIKSKTFVGQAQKNGTGLSQKNQKKVLEEFSEGKLNVLVATSIAEEGLDIPEVNAVIFYEPVPSAIRAIQRAGRTARLSKGKLIMLITKGTRDESFFYVSKAREKKMKTAIEGIQRDLDNGIKFKNPDEQRKL
jgi:Fanconi anemia group M protein